MRRLAVLLALAALLARPAVGAGTAGTARPLSGVDAKSGIEITLNSPFDMLPHAGFAPVLLTVRNDTDRERTWSFSFTSTTSYDDKRSFRSGATITVGPRATKTIEVMIPLTTATETYAYPRLTTRSSGHGAMGAVDIWTSGSASYGGSRLQPFVAMADTLATSAWGPLEAELKKESRELVGTRVVANLAPSDYRGWMGCDTVWLGTTDWDGMAPAQRAALLDWVRLGGTLHLCRSSSMIEAIEIPDAGPLGFGAVRTHTFRDNAALVREVVDAVRAEPSLLNALHNGYNVAWPLRNGVPEVVVRPGLILLFVIVFALVVGPVNLFVLARRGRHLHLFWTTPALSIAASVVLAIVIVLQDGFGGRGFRYTAVYLDSDAHQACQVQEQVSRTGVLLAREMPVRSPAFLTIVNTDHSGFTRQHSYSAYGNTVDGDWFASRSVQGQYAALIEPTRARVEIGAGADGAPSVLSSLAAPLEEFYYRDTTGRLWHGTDIRTGERHALKTAAEDEFRKWWRTQAASAGGRISPLLAALPGRNGHFFASTTEGGGQPLDTLPSIRWQEKTVLYIGPVTAPGGGRP